MSFTQTDPQKLAKLGRINFWFFCRAIIGNDWLTEKVHLPLCNFLQIRYPNKKLIELPRGFLKTTVASTYYPIWRVVSEPHLRFLIVQNTFDNAAKRVHEIRSIFEKNELFRACYPELIPNFNSKSIRWSDECAEVNRPQVFPEGTFEAAGVGTKITARHYDEIIEDDLVTPDVSDMSEEEIIPNLEDIKKAIGWHKMATNLLIDYRNSARIQIGTRWFLEDMIGWIKENEPNYARYFMNPYGKPEGDYREDYDPIYPQRFDREILEQKRIEMGTYMFATQMMLNPMPSSKMIFKPMWNRYYNVVPETTNILALDTALGQKEENCDSAFIVGGGADNKLIYILEAINGQFEMPDQIKLAFMLIRKYNIHKVIIETIAYQEALAKGIEMERDKIDENGIKINEDAHFTVIREDPKSRDAKSKRIKGLVPYFENGKILMSKEMRNLEKQLREYPHGRKVDLLDALGYLVRNMNYKLELRTIKVHEPFSFEAIMEELEGKKNREKYPFAKARSYSMRGGNTYNN
jgi:phage terminase large subunit-like protein